MAVLLAGAANFIGYFTFGTAVAKTIGMGVVHMDLASLSTTLPLRLILAALIGASIWNITTWILGLPTSSSHALIGGLIGAGLSAIGSKAIIVGGVLKIFLFIFIAPILGFAGAFLVTAIARWIARPFHPSRINPFFKYLQIVSSISASIGHGTNDAQKSMGIIALTLFAAHLTPSFQLKPWIVIACYSAISLGTTFGGWRIVRTMGTQITKVGPTEGFCSGAAASGVLFFATHLGHSGQHYPCDLRQPSWASDRWTARQGPLDHCPKNRMGMVSDHPAHRGLRGPGLFLSLQVFLRQVTSGSYEPSFVADLLKHPAR